MMANLTGGIENSGRRFQYSIKYLREGKWATISPFSTIVVKIWVERILQLVFNILISDWSLYLCTIPNQIFRYPGFFSLAWSYLLAQLLADEDDNETILCCFNVLNVQTRWSIWLWPVHNCICCSRSFLKDSIAKISFDQSQISKQIFHGKRMLLFPTLTKYSQSNAKSFKLI